MGEKSLNELLDSKNLKYSEIDINDYTIIKTLGNSNSSYLIRKKETPDFYVMKLFDMKSDKALEYAERAEEVTLNYHQTFVRFCGFSRQISINGVNQIAFLSEYIPNGSLRNYFDDIHKNDENSKKLKAKEPIIMYGIAMGLYQLHYHLILHKVIKPEHIYLDSYYHPYINVFKLQKNKTLMDYQQSISNQEDFSYLPPEFFDDDSHIIDNENITLFDINASISSDVYSYCLMLFEAFTSQFPSISNKNKKNLDEIKDIIKSEFLTSEQIEILTQLLNKNPTYRPGLDYVLKLMEKFYNYDNYYGADFAEYLNSLRLDRKVAIYSKQIISQLDNVNPMGAEMMEIQKYRDKTEFEELMNNYKNLQSDDLDFRANRKLLLKKIKSIGLQYLAQNDYKSAELYYENVIKSIDADNNHFMFHLGHILLHSYDEEQQKKGIQFLEKSAKNNYRKSIEDLSYYYFMKKEYSKSIEYIEQGKSLEKQSQKCLYLFQLGRYLKIQGFGEHTDVDDAIISNLEIPDGEALLGKILFHLNDPEHSKQHLINAIKNKSSIAFGFFGDVLADSDEDHTNKSKMNYRSFPYYQQSSIFNEIDGSLQLGKYYKSEYETHSNFILKEFSLYYLKKAKKMGSFEAQCLMEEVVDSLDSEMLIPYQANLCNYDVIRKIGKGNQGKVYLVQDKKTKSYCILKIIKNFDEKLFVREVNISFKINHPNVLHFIGFTKPVFKNNKLLLAPTILCEYIPNGNLGDLLKDIKNNKRKIDDTDKFIIAYGIASGMKELHSHSIIHRDLKPDNVLLDDNNQTYIADFGLSKTLYEDNIAFSEVRGTPAYTPPDETLNKKYDVFSFGIIFFQLVRNIELEEILHYIDEKDLPEHTSKVEEDQNVFFSYCCFENQENRPSFDEILRCFESSLEQENDFTFFENVDKEKAWNYVKKVQAKKIRVFIDPSKINKLKDICPQSHRNILEKYYQYNSSPFLNNVIQLNSKDNKMDINIKDQSSNTMIPSQIIWNFMEKYKIYYTFQYLISFNLNKEETMPSKLIFGLIMNLFSSSNHNWTNEYSISNEDILKKIQYIDMSNHQFVDFLTYSIIPSNFHNFVLSHKDMDLFLAFVNNIESNKQTIFSRALFILPDMVNFTKLVLLPILSPLYFNEKQLERVDLNEIHSKIFTNIQKNICYFPHSITYFLKSLKEFEVQMKFINECYLDEIINCPEKFFLIDPWYRDTYTFSQKIISFISKIFDEDFRKNFLSNILDEKEESSNFLLQEEIKGNFVYSNIDKRIYTLNLNIEKVDSYVLIHSSDNSMDGKSYLINNNNNNIFDKFDYFLETIKQVNTQLSYILLQLYMKKSVFHDLNENLILSTSQAISDPMLFKDYFLKYIENINFSPYKEINQMILILLYHRFSKNLLFLNYLSQNIQLITVDEIIESLYFNEAMKSILYQNMKKLNQSHAKDLNLAIYDIGKVLRSAFLNDGDPLTKANSILFSLKECKNIFCNKCNKSPNEYQLMLNILMIYFRLPNFMSNIIFITDYIFLLSDKFESYASLKDDLFLPLYNIIQNNLWNQNNAIWVPNYSNVLFKEIFIIVDPKLQTIYEDKMKMFLKKAGQYFINEIDHDYTINKWNNYRLNLNVFIHVVPIKKARYIHPKYQDLTYFVYFVKNQNSIKSNHANNSNIYIINSEYYQSKKFGKEKKYNIVNDLLFFEDIIF